MTHVGIGYDVHRLVPGRKLVLGGVEIPFEKGLDGHSDADVLMHAICDAVLGTMGMRDIVSFFPNSDPSWKDAPCKLVFDEAALQVKLKVGTLSNTELMISAEERKVSSH